jgi:hypothetical protein
MRAWLRAGQAGALALGVLMSAGATARAAPELAITSPSNESAIHDTTPVFKGTTSDFEDLVALEIHPGADLDEPPVQKPPAQLPAWGGDWTVTLVESLPEGVYTAVAKQTDFSTSEQGVSAPVTFTVQTQGATPLPESPPTTQPGSRPAASFVWIPSRPRVGEAVSLISSSNDFSSAIVSYAWDTSGAGPLMPGGSLLATSFATAGPHVVRLLVTAADAQTDIATETIPVGAAAAKRMQPYPVIRLAGVQSSRGARVRLLTVLAPPGALVTIRCRGRGCGTALQSRLAVRHAGEAPGAAVLLSFPRFQRLLHPGVLLEIRVSRSGELGKYTSFSIRRRRPPSRNDKCLAPGEQTPIPCPPA